MSIIPKMTHPLSSVWDQPNHENFLFDDTYVIMTKRDFEELKNYSMSRPSGVYDGKMWKSKYGEVWDLRWYGPAPDPNQCRTFSREIIVL